MPANPFSRLGYLALGKETEPGTTVKPTVYVELIEEDVNVEYAHQAVTPIAGKRTAKLRTVKDKITIGGDIKIIVEPRTLGHFLAAALGAPATSTIVAGKVYQHIFTPANALQTYTMDIKRAGESIVRRLIGVYVEKIEFSQSDNRIECTLTVKAMKAFDHARLTANSAPSDTSYDVDQTSGITTDDILEVRSRNDQDTVLMTHSVAAVGSELALTVDAKAVAATASDLVLIKAATGVLYTTSDDLTWIGGSKVATKAEDDNYNAIDNTVAADAEDYTLAFSNMLEERYTAAGTNLAHRFPTKIFVKDFEAEGSLTHYYTEPAFIDDLRQTGKVALRMRHYGARIDTNSAVAASLNIGSEPGRVTVTADVASETGSDLNVTIITASDDTLAASKTGNNILVKLANATASKNRANLVATAIAALSGVGATASSTTVSVAVAAKSNLTGGRNANQRAQLRVDFPDVRFRPFSPNIKAEDLINEEIEYDAYYDDTESTAVKVVLTNNHASY